MEYIQPIVLLVDRSDPASHQDAIAASALASVRAFEHSLASGENMARWWAWMDDAHGKSVRRAKPGPFAAITKDHPAMVRVGKAAAAAFSPVDAAAMPAPLARLQVSGTQLPQGSLIPLTDSPSPAIVLNAGLGMSTGKSCAQAAHALMNWYLAAPVPARTAWAEAGYGVRVYEAAASRFSSLARMASAGTLIHDHGRTEIAAGSATAFIAGGV